jgi:hypothetical protein
MRIQHGLRAVAAGWTGGFIGNGVLGALFASAPVQAILYDPTLQSRLFLEVTPTRDVPLSVAGLVVLSAIHGVLFAVFQPSIPGASWVARGVFWGGTIWAMYWLFQEWFVYHTLLQEPLILTFVELTLLAIGSVVEGLVIAFILRPR